MAFQDGDVIRFDYTLWVDGEGKPLETSLEDVAHEHGIHRPDKQYRPMTVTLGARQIIPGLDAHIRSHGKVGATVTAELAAADAYGPRDAQKIRDVPMAQFRKQGVKPEVGLVLNLQGERGLITRVAGGRVRVDMNHALAGKDLRYEYTVRERIEDTPGKVAAVMRTLFGDDPPAHSVEDGTVSVEVPRQARFDQEWLMQKLHLVSGLRAAAGRDATIVLTETFEPMPPASEEE